MRLKRIPQEQVYMTTTNGTARRQHETPSTPSTTNLGTYAQNVILYE